MAVLLSTAFDSIRAEEELNLDDFILDDSIFEEDDELPEVKDQGNEEEKDKKNPKLKEEKKPDSDEDIFDELDDTEIDDESKNNTKEQGEKNTSSSEVKKPENKQDETVNQKEDLKIIKSLEISPVVDAKKEKNLKTAVKKEIKFKKPNTVINIFRKPYYAEEILENVSLKQPSLISIVEDDFNFLDAEYIKANGNFQELSTLNNKIIKTEHVEKIEIDKGDFKDPFYEDEIAVEDLPDDERELDLSSIESANDSGEKPNRGTRSSVKKEKNFYLRDKSLKVEVKNNFSEGPSLFSNAFAALQAGHYESAVAYYEKILEKNPKNQKAMFGAATAYHYLKDYIMAKAYYKKLIKLGKNNIKAFNNYILLLIEESPKKAKENLIKLWASNPRFAPIPSHLGNLAFDDGDYRKAMEYYLKAIELDRKNYKYMNNLAVTLEVLGANKEAVSVYKKLYTASVKGTYKPEKANFFREKLFNLMSSN